MDIIFGRRPRNADAAMDYSFGVKQQKRRRSKPDEYVDPFRKMKKRPKSAADSRSGNDGSSRAGKNINNFLQPF